MMSTLDQRILLYTASGSTWTDLTLKLCDPTKNQTQAFSMSAGDCIYISSFLPFNHKYFKVTTAAGSTKPVKIETNDLSTWYEVADYLDQTRNMQESGNMQFTRDRDKGWGRVGKSKEIPELASAPFQIYDSYWTRISFPTAVVPLTFTLSYIGQCFSTDDDLLAQYPALRSTQLLTAWAAGKTSWLDQHLLAAGYIAKTLRQRNIIFSNEQLLDISTLVSAAVHKTAEIIYGGLGAKNYEKEIAITSARFEKAMKMDKFHVDSDMDGIKSVSDSIMTVSRMSR
jgi:hypothetical protein